VDSTLREGEQFATGDFTPEERVYIAKQLDRLGVDYIETVNPIASEQAMLDNKRMATLGLRAKILTHTRCHMSDVKAAVESGVHGVNIYMATSPILSKHSHGKGIDAVIETAKEVIKYAQSRSLEVRFSCEDTFRSDRTDLLKIYKAVDALGVDRVGLADTVGVATPQQVADTVKAVRGVLSPSTGIEFHTHNDTGCCIANALIAVENGATHIDTCVLGIGERNGITPVGGFLGRMYTLDKDHIKSRFDLPVLRHLERFVAQTCGVRIPFNNYITGSTAFTHKAGVHSKAVMANPNAYEVIDPADFGIERQIQFAHRLTGWNAIYGRSKQLNLDLSDDQVKAATSLIKNLADEQEVTLEEVDTVLYHLASAPRTSSSVFKQFIVDQGLKAEVPAELRLAAEQAAAAIAQFEHANALAAVRAIRAKASVDTRPTAYYKAQGHLFDTRAFNTILDKIVDSTCQFEIVHLEVPHENHLPSMAFIKVWADSAQEVANLGEQIQAIASKIEGVTVSEVDRSTVPLKK